MKPSSRSDTVGDVSELVRSVDFDEIFEDCGLDEIRVQFSNTIHLVRADDGQVSHTDHLWLRLLDDRNTAKHVSVFREVALNILQELEIDLVDDLKMTGK